MANILITAPSLDENINISGISSLAKTIINNNSEQHSYFHFRLGKKDSEGKGLKWLFNQLLIIPGFLLFTLKNNITLIHLNTDLTPLSLIRDFPLLITGKFILRKKILLHLHGGRFLMKPPPSRSIFFFLIKTMLKNADTTVVLSETERTAIARSYILDCSVLPNAVKSNNYRSDKDFSGKLTFFFMGRIVEAKGIFLICECLKELASFFSQFSLHIYGTGPDKEELLSKLSSINGLNYSYHGVVRGNYKEEVLRNAHVFLLPSLFGEGLPIAMLESMSYGCIPIVSDDASISTVISNNHNGYISTKGNAEGLKANLIKALTYRERLTELSKNARNTIVSRYDLKNYLTSLNELYQKINSHESDKLFRHRAEPHHIQ